MCRAMRCLTFDVKEDGYIAFQRTETSIMHVSMVHYAKRAKSRTLLHPGLKRLVAVSL